MKKIGYSVTHYADHKRIHISQFLNNLLQADFGIFQHT